MKIRLIITGIWDGEAVPTSDEELRAAHPWCDLEIVRVGGDVLDDPKSRSAFVAALETSKDVGYVAMRDVNDAWIDSAKLRRQIDWLGDHPRASACFHSVALADEDTGESVLLEPPGVLSEYGIEDIWVESDFVVLSSLVLRTDVLDPVPDWMSRPIVNPAFGLAVCAARAGSLGYLAEPMVHASRSACIPARHEEAEIHERRLVNARLEFRYQEYMGRFVASRGVSLARTCLEQDRVVAARRHFATAWSHLPVATTLLSGLLPLKLWLAGRRRRA